MAITNLEVCERFIAGRKGHNLNMKSDEYVGSRKLLSYATPIAECTDEGNIWVCEDKFSVSTARQQSTLRSALYQAGYKPTQQTIRKDNRTTYRGPNVLTFVLYKK